MKRAIAIGVCAAPMFCCLNANAGDSDLAKQLNNPIASLTLVPFQGNYDTGYGPEDGYKAFVNLQPVIPVSLSDDWNLISRSILPVAWQNDIAGESGDQFGLGDLTQSLFFSPVKPTAGGLIWGVGPVFLIPTATDELLGGEKWGGGPTGVVLKQSGPWTIGMLVNHVWSFAGDDERSEINNTFMQPFLAHTSPTALTFTLNTETSYDWEGEEWSVPPNLQVSQVLKLGKQPVSIFAGARYWAESTENGPDGWGLRLGITLLYPKK